MGLQSVIQKAVGQAFEAIGDLQQLHDYVHEGQEPDYDSTTGDVIPDVARVTLQVRATILAAGKDSLDKLPTSLMQVARPGDQLALIPGVDMTISPTTGDQLIKDDSTWRVKGFVLDPAGGLWKVLVTRVGGGADGQLVFHE